MLVREPGTRRTGLRGGIFSLAVIARRWGWASHSQFTVACQKRFGVLPIRTLRS